MITGLGIGLVGFGLILAYAGVTGQHVKQELGIVFGRAGGATAPAAGAGLTFKPGDPQAIAQTLRDNPLPTGVR